ncbi:MAG: hypothetical protein FWD28_02415 [Treponema sp.]|nr:hypothetical protein [Treponema sp.]
MNKKYLITIILSVIFSIFLISCENPFMMGVAGDYVYNIEDFGRGATPKVHYFSSFASLSSELDFINSSSVFLCHVINLSGDIVIGETDSFNFTGLGRMISIRGGRIIISDDATLEIENGATLILRDITIISDTTKAVDVGMGSTLIMEAGSNITGSGIVAVAVSGGTFIMNGGTIYNFRRIYEFAYEDGGIITINSGSHFSKNRGAIIYGREAPPGLRNTVDGNGNIISVIHNNLPFRARNTTVGERETLSITIDNNGNITGNW